MKKTFAVVGFLSLALHFAMVTTSPVNASNGSCTAGGADGCGCTPLVCEADDEDFGCFIGIDYTPEFGCNEGGEYAEDGSYSILDPGGDTVCSFNVPLVGAGCSDGSMAACKIEMSCFVDAFGVCDSIIEEEGGFYFPCTPN